MSADRGHDNLFSREDVNQVFGALSAKHSCLTDETFDNINAHHCWAGRKLADSPPLLTALQLLCTREKGDKLSREAPLPDRLNRKLSREVTTERAAGQMGSWRRGTHVKRSAETAGLGCLIRV